MSLKLLKKDLLANTNSKALSQNLKCLLVSHSMHLVILIRLAQSFGKIPKIGKTLLKLTEYIIRIIFSSDISCNAKIGEGLVIIHGHDIVIGADVEIGKNCKIFNGVTLGNKNVFEGSKNNQPKVGDNCILCTGSKILGPIKISNNVIVAANAVVINDCGSNLIVGGMPAKQIGINNRESL